MGLFGPFPDAIDLADHIAASQVHSPGVRLEADGGSVVCHEALYFPWRVLDEDGRGVDRGANFGRGLRAVHGFRLTPDPAASA